MPRDDEPGRNPADWTAADPLLTECEAQWYAKLWDGLADDGREGDEPGSGVRRGGPRPRPEPAGV